MRDFKQLLPFRGKSFVETCVDNLQAARVAEIVVVTGYRAKDVRAALAHKPARCVYNPDFKIGMSTSIKRGVEAAAAQSTAFLIALVDQPQIGPGIIDQIITRYTEGDSLVVVPRYGGRNGHPVILDGSLRQEILAMDEAIGLRQVIHAHADRTAQVGVSSEAVLLDFDYPEEYKKHLNRDPRQA